ncbi:Sip5p [Aspergillus clavatus NRRL 1]|uniref:Protein sip5 n=1 Tax=Aspergillus clavatus (strain ATCC 1007 / CBS 513.65 / DSM 816 / NCTC 3887 / NRRL 1 / QM 1276 / 107) TaxID=344612 RepID=SIP5_ASPCL|nr:C2H2 zinc finger protein [Aspergillus clavatus NRRL 1]A1C3V7.1 RecName: Full=Protein sip5 [Aspergillus clavatus NRRL 1]EAW15097.1 C2H2 zinc finger protein [Aspergillus clavatus NRRL 1]
MGNSQTKESRPSLSSSNRRGHQWGSSSSHGRSPYGDRHHAEGSRSRGSRPDLSMFGIGGSSDRDVATLEHRRETKQEREARRLEKERVARLKERERSMREEHVDGGYLVTQGVYVGTEDFNKAVTRQLMIERRLAPFWRGLNDFSDSWTEHQLMAAARGLPIPPPDEIPPELEYKNPPRSTEEAKESTIQHLMVPITSRSQSYGSEASQSSTPTHSLPSPTSPFASGTSSSPLFRTRAKTLASLTSSRHGSQVDAGPKEIQLPKDPFVNGQPIEAYLYKDATECPICFLYYPPYLNRTRCCDQPICSECFVQIKRPDPHPPEHGETDSNAANSTSDRDRQESQDGQLVSGPAACPFCVQPEFGVTYAPPPFRRGLVYATDSSLRPTFASPVSSSSSLSSANPPAITGRRRATSLSANDPTVITTDRIRPDWAQKLANARAHAARRSAAATALHTAAYLMNTNSSGNESRNFSLGRRGVMRRTGTSENQSVSNRSGSPALQALAFLTDRRAVGPETDFAEEGGGNMAPPRNSSRRNRIDDLEEMMMMEAIRLSLASEEERRRKEEKEAKKEAKRREKESKKAEKAARKLGVYSNNASSSALDVLSDPRHGKGSSSSSSMTGEDTACGKGKEVERMPPSTTNATASPSSLEIPSDAANSSPVAHVIEPGSSAQAATTQSLARELPKPSHLRHVSSASSSFSSLVDSTPDDPTGAYDGSATATEPMFNFRSLAAVIGDEDKGVESTEHVEDTSSRATVASSASGVAPSATETSGAPATGVEPVSVETITENGDCLMPKELETRSVEITHTAPNTEATS